MGDHTGLIPALKILGEPSRLRILCSLGLECRPVTDVIRATGLGQTNVSFHLRILREAGFIRAERRGQFIYYCLADVGLLRILQDLKHWMEGRKTIHETACEFSGAACAELITIALPAMHDGPS